MCKIFIILHLLMFMPCRSIVDGNDLSEEGKLELSRFISFSRLSVDDSSCSLTPIELHMVLDQLDVKAIQEKSRTGKWKKSMMHFGKQLEELLEAENINELVKNAVGKTPRSRDVLHIRMEIFKHICIGAVAKQIDCHCLLQFTLTYPDVILEVAKNGQHLFLNKKILRETCIEAIRSGNSPLKHEILQAFNEHSSSLSEAKSPVALNNQSSFSEGKSLHSHSLSKN
jgi:hypothetical protein